MTAGQDEARARDLLYGANGLAHCIINGYLDTAIVDLAAALSEARDQGAAEVCRQIREAMATKDEARDLLFGPMGLSYSMMNGYHDIAVEDLAFVLECQRHKGPTVALPATPSPAIAPPPPSAADITALQAEEFIRTVCRELSLPYNAKPFDAAKRIREMQRQIERAPAIAPLREAVVAGVPVNRFTGRPCDHSYVRNTSGAISDWVCDLCGNKLDDLAKAAQGAAAEERTP